MGEVGRVIVMEREEIEGLREEREVLELELKKLGKMKKCKEGGMFLKALLEEKESRERGMWRAGERWRRPRAVGGGHEEDGNRDLGEAAGVRGEEGRV